MYINFYFISYYIFEIDLKNEQLMIIKDQWTIAKLKDLSVLQGYDGLYNCPRSFCAKYYRRASDLQRHIRYVKYNVLINVTLINVLLLQTWMWGNEEIQMWILSKAFFAESNTETPYEKKIMPSICNCWKYINSIW